MSFYSNHWYFEEEKKLGSTFFVDLKIWFDFEKAWENDELENTINYVELYNLIEIEMKQTSYLIENVAYRILFSIKKSFPEIKYINVKVHKPNAPIWWKIEDLYVEIEKEY